MPLPEVSSAPQLDIITNIPSSYEKEVSLPYVDAYNQAAMAKYNNEYNYWLWKQQIEYNSPANQVARLKEAGLNPNFNSIDGTGNASSIPASSGSISPSVGRNVAQRTQNIISTASTILSAFSTGLNAVSVLSDTPPLSKLPEYRNTLFQIGKQTLKGKELDNYKRLVDSIVETYMAGGRQLPMTLEDEAGNVIGEVSDTPFAITHPDQGIGGIVFEPDKMIARTKAEADVSLLNQRLRNLGLDFDIKNLVKAAKSYYNKEIQPHEAEKAKGLAGTASFGQLINKVANGESLSFNEIIAAILALAALKL